MLEAMTTTPAEPQTDSATAPAVEAQAAPSQGDQYRDAYQRLASGERPEVINGSVAQPTAIAPAASDQTQPSAPGSPGQASDPWKGLSPEQVQWLKRDGYTEEDVAFVPPSNLKKLASKAQERVSNRDRAYQQAKAGKSDQQSGDPASPSAAQANQQARQDGSGTAAPPAPDSTQTQTKDPSPGDQPPGPQLALAPDWKAPTMPDDDYRTLADIAGNEFADKIKAGYDRAAQATIAAVKPIETTLLNVLSYIERNEFNAALKELKTRPEYGKLTDDDVSQLRDKAEHLMRAHANPLEYRYEQALPEAAQALFKLDPVKAAQAQLLTRRTASLQRTADPGRNQQPSQPVAMSETERAAAILRTKQANPQMSWDDARTAVDSGAA